MTPSFPTRRSADLIDHYKYLEEPAAHLAPEDRWHLLDQDESGEQLPEAPLGNFFNDDLLTLLYHSKSTCPGALESVRRNLFIVVGRGPSHVRAAAALALGRFLQHRCQPDEFRVGSSR